MVKKCEACRKHFMKDSRRSFYLFPMDMGQRRLWFSCLAIKPSETIILQRYIYVCSDHFEESDFYFRRYGKDGFRKLLKKNAKPRIKSKFLAQQEIEESAVDIKVDVETLENREFSSQKLSGIDVMEAEAEKYSYISTIVEIKTEPDESITSTRSFLSTAEIDIEEGNLQLEHIQQLPSPCRSEENVNIDQACDPLSSSSSTITASEVGSETEETQLLSPQDRQKPLDTVDTIVESGLLTDMDAGSNLEIVVKTKQPQKRKLKQVRYPGDVKIEDFSSPIRAEHNWNIAKKKIAEQKRKIKHLQQSNRRLKDRVKCLNSLKSYLKDSSFITATSQTTPPENLPNSARELFDRLSKAPSNQQSDPNLRSFVMILNSYSPKAYKYMRQKCNRSLPDPNTIAKWHQSPGFTKEALVALKLKVAEAKMKDETVSCNLIMEIRKEEELDKKRASFYASLGSSSLDLGTKPTETLVFILVDPNQEWKIPFGYFLIQGLGESEKANLLQQALEFVHGSGMIVTSLTFDGAPSNFAIAESLGVDLSEPDSVNTHFSHPITGEPVNIFLKPSHTMKLGKV